jgi:TrmH family RNA methyltransferase
MLVKQKIKYIQSLGQKKFREETGMFIAEGPKLVDELLQTGIVKEIYAVKEWIQEQPVIPKDVQVTEISEIELERISQLTTPNKVVAVVQQDENRLPADTRGRIILALDTIQDPGNLGTIIRIADWFGIEQIVCTPDSADRYNPKVVQATMGSIGRVKVYYTELDEWLAKQKNTRIYAASLEGQDIGTMKKINEGIIVIGNESKGISLAVMNLVNVKITIPRKGKAESLNAALAAGIILSHLS